MEMIQEVTEVLNNPINNRGKLKHLAWELCKYPMNLNCSSCITEAIMSLSKWLKAQGVQNDFFKRATSGEYELKKLNLFVQVYKSDNLARQKELDTCLKINKNLSSNGVKWFNVIEINERLTFRQMFELIKKYPNDINIISNSDIYFDDTILACRFINKNEVLALSRWDYNNGNMAILFNRKDSQDVWVFNGEVNCNGGDYQLGTRGCDNKIAWELKQAGYNVLNPAKSIHAIHLHNSNHRTYTSNSPAVPEPYYFIHPHY